MTLQMIKSAFYQSGLGSMLTDNADISEPVPTLTEDGMVQNFFLYMVDPEAGFFSAPFARAGILPEEKRVIYFTSCYDQPFSKPPEEILKAEGSFTERFLAYEHYKRRFNATEHLFFRDCSKPEKRVVREYVEGLQLVTDPVMYPFYAEMAPEFFTWISRNID